MLGKNQSSWWVSRRTVAIVAVVLLLVLSGCADRTEQTPTPGPTIHEEPQPPNQGSPFPEGYRENVSSLASNVSATGEWERVQTVGIDISAEYDYRPHSDYIRAIRVAAARLNDRPEFGSSAIKYEVRPNASDPDISLDVEPEPCDGAFEVQCHDRNPAISGEMSTKHTSHLALYVLGNERYGNPQSEFDLVSTQDAQPWDPIRGGGNITIAVEVDTENADKPRSELIEMTRQQVTFWNRAGPIYGHWYRPLEVAPDANNPDVIVHFQSDERTNLSYDGGEAPVLSNEYRNVDDRPYHVRVELGTSLSSEYPYTIRHELGHLMGLNHGESHDYVGYDLGYPYPWANKTEDRLP